jgi:hypothetical protein
MFNKGCIFGEKNFELYQNARYNKNCMEFINILRLLSETFFLFNILTLRNEILLLGV